MKAITIEQIVSVTGGILLAGAKEAKIEQITIDSREDAVNGLFVPIVGEKTDGHKYVAGAAEHGATALFMQESSSFKEEILALAAEKKLSVISVKDTVRALQDVAGWYRNQYKVPVVGITGSVGKTTTKEMIFAALETEKRVLKTIGNKNSQIGLAQMMFYLEESFDIAVIEMGMSEVGEMKNLARVARPECAVMTNIGVAHIAQLGSRENIRKEKLNIVNEFVQESCLIVNGNDPLLNETATQITQNAVTIDCDKETKLVLENKEASESSISAVTYGIGEGFDYSAGNIRATASGVRFDVTVKKTQKSYPVQLKVYGNHNVMNALAAIAVAERYGIAPECAIPGLSVYEPIAMRGQIKKKDGITWIDDTYNASPDSMRSGVQVLLSLESKRRIAVLADVLELGEQSEQLHREVGTYIATTVEQRVDCLVTVGPNSAFIADEAGKHGMQEIHSFSTNVDAEEFLKTYLCSGDTVLVKGSRGMRTEEILQAFEV